MTTTCLLGSGMSGVAGCRTQSAGGDAAGTQRGQEILETTKVAHVMTGGKNTRNDLIKLLRFSGRALVLVKPVTLICCTSGGKD